MQEKTAQFRASSGRLVRVDENGHVVFAATLGFIGKDVVTDAEEFFQAREDARRGRWRSPLHPDFVVYPADGDSAIVVDERDGMSMWFNDETAQGEDPYCRVARGYFEAHPQRKPWHDAQPWETWVLTVDGDEWAVTLDEDREFRDQRSDHNAWMSVRNNRITAGRRIWPEDAS